MVKVGEYRWEDGRTVIEVDLNYGDVALYAFEAVETEPDHVVASEADTYVTEDGIVIRPTQAPTAEPTTEPMTQPAADSEDKPAGSAPMSNILTGVLWVGSVIAAFVGGLVAPMLIWNRE